MESFNIYFEKSMRNPLRKKELEKTGAINKKEWVENESKKLTQKQQTELQKFSNREGVTDEQIQHFEEELVNRNRKKLESEYFTGKKRESLRLLKKYRNVKIYADQYVENLKISLEDMKRSLWMLLSYYKETLPRRGFDIVLTNSNNNPDFITMSNLGRSDEKAAAYYQGNQIFVDEKQANMPTVLLHEYAHLLADRVSKQVEPILKNEYEKMINSYFEEKNKKRSRRRHLQGSKNAQNRMEITKKFRLPDPYAATNFDEWFAVTIENWKHLPNNIHTYRFKTIFKKILNRL